MLGNPSGQKNTNGFGNCEIARGHVWSVPRISGVNRYIVGMGTDPSENLTEAVSPLFDAAGTPAAAGVVIGPYQLLQFFIQVCEGVQHAHQKTRRG